MRIVRCLVLSLLTLTLAAGLTTRAGAKVDVCGDGETTGNELCDDGNTVSGDLCSYPSCLPEECGDGIPNPDPPYVDECDDGDTVGGDGCSANCELECGNGALESGEDCDTSGESATCDDDCTNVECRDANVNEAAGELCDDGNTVDGDACSNSCLPPPSLSPVSKAQQACINATNKNLAGVAKAQNGDTAACLKAAASGKSTFAACYGTDVKGKVGKAQAKTATVSGKKCTGDGLPTIAFTTSTIVNDAGEVEILEGSTIVLGAPPTIAPKSDKAASGCQAEALKQYAAIVDKWLAEANKAKKSALKGGKGGTPPPVGSNAELADAIDAALDDNEQVVKAVTKASTGLTQKCSDAIVDASFDCGGAATVEALRACVAAAAQASACEAFEAADGLDLTCAALGL